MATSCYKISLHHLTNHLIYLSSSSSFWFSLNSSYKHDFHLLLESTSLEPLTLDEEVHMQEEWHCNERKCTFVVLTRNLLLLDLDISDDNQPCVAIALLLHIPLPMHCHCTFYCHCPRAVHCILLPLRRRRAIDCRCPRPVHHLPLLHCAPLPCCRRAATMPLLSCRRQHTGALPPPLLLLPPRRCQAAIDVMLLPCRHRRTAAKLPPTLRCRAAATTAVPPSCRRLRAVALLPLPGHRQAAADIALWRCRHHRSRRAAAAALPPLRCAPPLTLPPPPCRQQAAATAAPSPFLGWLLHCCLSSNFVIACRHVTVDALVAGHFHQ